MYGIFEIGGNARKVRAFEALAFNTVEEAVAHFGAAVIAVEYSEGAADVAVANGSGLNVFAVEAL